MGKGGTTVVTPGPTPEETQLQREQIDLLKQQREQLQQQLNEYNLLAPTLFEQVGLRMQRDETGKLIGIEKLPAAALSPEEQRKAEIQKLLDERSLAALRGELPVNPALLTQLGQEESTLRETLFKNLGPGFETSTPGIQALGEFQKRKSDILEAARRGDLSLAEGLSQAREGSILQRKFGDVSTSLIPSSRYTNILGGFAGVNQGFNGPLSEMFNNRQQILNTNISNADRAQRSAAGIGQLFGTGLTAAATYYGMAAF